MFHTFFPLGNHLGFAFALIYFRTFEGVREQLSHWKPQCVWVIDWAIYNSCLFNLYYIKIYWVLRDFWTKFKAQGETFLSSTLKYFPLYFSASLLLFYFKRYTVTPGEDSLRKQFHLLCAKLCWRMLIATFLNPDVWSGEGERDGIRDLLSSNCASCVLK